MPHRTPRLVLLECTDRLSASHRLTIAAHRWCSPSFKPPKPKFTVKHRDILVESAFLRVYLAWEQLLEESFILYLLGRRSPSSYSPSRLAGAIPTTRKDAITLTAAGQKYANWDNPESVRRRSLRFFRSGAPYETTLAPRINVFLNMQVVRNSLVHRSDYSKKQFEQVVRNNLGFFPSDMTVGVFLGTTVPGSNPPISFFELYLNNIDTAAQKIIPR